MDFDLFGGKSGIPFLWSEDTECPSMLNVLDVVLTFNFLPLELAFNFFFQSIPLIGWRRVYVRLTLAEWHSQNHLCLVIKVILAHLLVRVHRLHILYRHSRGNPDQSITYFKPSELRHDWPRT